MLSFARGSKQVNVTCRKIWWTIYRLYPLSIILRDWLIAAASQRGHIIFINLKLK